MTRAKKISDAVARTGRGGVQGGLGYALVQAVDSFHHLTGHQFGAVLLLATIVVAYAQNVCEAKGWLPPLLKQTGDPGSQPVVGD